MVYKCTAPVFLTWYALTGCAPAMGAETRRALLVGIDLYQSDPPAAPASAPAKPGEAAASARSPARGRGLISNLDGAINDIEELREILLTPRYGFREENVHTLKNAEATRVAIQAAFQKHLIDAAAPGDVCLFFYAGHGSQLENPKSDEPDKMDETLVPADAAQGVCDIRDKELSRLFNKALDKGVVLTAIFDSCHSGSIARGVGPAGKARSVPPDPMCRVEDPPDPGPKPEARGALVISAAQDDQPARERKDANGIDHGIFSEALLKTLRTASPNESAQRIFLMIKASMPGGGRTQEPVLAGTAERKKKPLFGVGSGPLSDRATVAILKVEKDGRVELQGGKAVGLRENCELKRAGATARDPSVRVRVTAVAGLSRCEAKVIEGDVKTIHAGDLFELDRWVAPDEANLRVWSPAGLPYGKVRRIGDVLSALRTSKRVQWVDDPTEQSPTHVLSWGNTEWQLSVAESRVESLGAELTAQAVLAKLAASAPRGPAKLFVYLPPPVELMKGMQLGKETPNDSVEFVSSPEQADYLLVGRRQGQKIQYAWVLPNADREDPKRPKGKAGRRQKALSGGAPEDPDPGSPLPLRTDWVTVGRGRASLAKAAQGLQAYALRIGKVKAWLQIDTPPDGGYFPYRLALKNFETKDLKTGGTLREKEPYGLVLQTEKEKLKRKVQRRYVYVFSIDSDGNSKLLFPTSGQGNVENRVPYDSDGDALPAEIQLGKEAIFSIGEPFGVETYILLTSIEPIPNPDILEFNGVRTRDPLTVRGKSPLQKLLSGIGSTTRGTRSTTPIDWSIERLSFKSVPLSQ